ncbi:hypothetical protein A2U01_0096894, partial [Trifolium medium]|nr:hypothetical protein [Trifolium medium]
MFVVMGVEVTITQNHIAKLIQADNDGWCQLKTAES